jgi:hypothetical protein
MRKTIFLSFCFLCLSVTIAMAHGIQVDYSLKYPQATLKFSFSKSSPLAHADVSVYSVETDELYISGKTDKNGEFVFMPDIPGDWTVKVDDGMGHRKTAVITIESDFFESDTIVQSTVKEHIHSDDCAHSQDQNHHHDHAHIPMVYKIIFGLALIFGITGVWYGLKARKK